MQLCPSLSGPKQEGCTRRKSPSGQIQRKAEPRFICQTDRWTLWLSVLVAHTLQMTMMREG